MENQRYNEQPSLPFIEENPGEQELDISTTSTAARPQPPRRRTAEDINGDWSFDNGDQRGRGSGRGRGRGRGAHGRGRGRGRGEGAHDQDQAVSSTRPRRETRQPSRYIQ